MLDLHKMAVLLLVLCNTAATTVTLSNAQEPAISERERRGLAACLTKCPDGDMKCNNRCISQFHRPQAVQLSSDVPSYRTHTGKFIWKLLSKDSDAVGSLVVVAGTKVIVALLWRWQLHALDEGQEPQASGIPWGAGFQF